MPRIKTTVAKCRRATTALRRGRIPHVVRHGGSDLAKFLPHPQYGELLTRILRQAEKVITDEQSEPLLRSAGAITELASVYEPDSKVFAPRHTPRSAPVPVYAYIGKINYYWQRRGLDQLVGWYRANSTKVALRIIGQGVGQAGFEHWMAAQGLSNPISVEPFVSPWRVSAHPGKVVVFTEFVPTLDHLARICEGHGISYSLFSGDLSRGQKDAAIALFRDQARVQLSTGAGGEGRNLQFADTVVNFDLPWNPMRIEQRVGRVHRIGQSRDVFVFNFCQEGTVEEQLLRVLHDKINMFELVVGEMDAILGTLDEGRDFAEIVMDLWVSGRQSGEVEQEFEELARRLLDAKKRHLKVQELGDSLFAHDFEA